LSVSLQEKGSSGLKWGLVTKVGRQIIQFVSYAIFARFLSPDDFGVVSMAMVVIAFGDTFRDFGIGNALIQRKEIDEKLISSLFWFNAFIGLVFTFIIAISSTFVSQFYNTERLTLILVLLSSIFFIGNLGGIHKSLIEKRLDFKKVYFTELISQLLAAFVGLGLIFNGGGIYSLVFQTIAFYSFFTIIIWTLNDWRPKIFFNFKEVNKVLNFSLNLTGFNFINFFSRNADYMIIGKYLGSAPLGIYTLAYRIMLYPQQYISSTIGNILFPIFSKVQEDDKKIGEAFIFISKMVSYIVFPLMFFIMISSDEIIYLILGPKWSEVSTILRILAPVSMVQSLLSMTGSIYLSKGRTNTFFKWGLFSTISVVISFFIGVNWGIIGVSLAYTIVVFILAVPGFLIPFNIINLSFKNYFAGLLKPLMFSLLLLIFIYYIRLFFIQNELNVFFSLSLQIITMIFIVFTLIYFFDKLVVEQIKLFVLGRN